MKELLSPAGSLDAFYAAISNGADAVYIGLSAFSARAYANNFDLETLEEIINYAHLRNVRVFVAMNTIIFDHELEKAFETIDTLASINVDAVIVQDLSLLNYITSNYESIEAHISTQMGIDDLEGIKFVHELGAKRVVLAREVNVENIKEYKKQVNIEFEVFIHGALCVSYSGNCFMSGLLGMRSGNRGRCVGSCRKLYGLVDETNNITYPKSYLFSMKDLNTSCEIHKLSFIDSFKIEGRMKEPSYVAGITRYYRDLLDGKKPNKDHLLKNFQRTFTKGYILDKNVSEITNTEKPNNYGYIIGKVIKTMPGKILIKLSDTLNQNDQIRIEAINIYDEISLPITKMYNESGQLINKSSTTCIVELKEKVKVGATIYKTKDVEYLKEIAKTFKTEYNRLPINMEVFGEINQPLNLIITYKNYKVSVKSNELIEAAKNSGLTFDNFYKQLSKLNETPYILNDLKLNLPDNIFIPLKSLNELRRQGIELLNEKRLSHKVVKTNKPIVSAPKFSLQEPTLVCSVKNYDQYLACLEEGIEEIFFENTVPRNNATFKEFDNVLVGGLNGVHYYKDKAKVTTDYSLNVVNHHSVYILHQHGVEKVTLSYEISKKDVNNLVSNYQNSYNENPNLELIVYGKQQLMVTKYCPLKRLNLCGNCKKYKYHVKDEIANFDLLFNDDCTVTVLNSRVLNLIDDLKDIKGINYYRLAFTNESSDDVKQVIRTFKRRLSNLSDTTKLFNSNTDTRGHFNKEIM